MDSSQSNSGRQTDDKAATSMDSSQPKRGFGRPKQTKEEAATSRERQREKRKERDAAQKAEGGTSRATLLQKNKRKALKQKGGAPYEKAKEKDAMRKRPAPIQSVDQKAADQGDAKAKLRRDKEAVRWYHEAADQGNANAQFFSDAVRW